MLPEEGSADFNVSVGAPSQHAMHADLSDFPVFFFPLAHRVLKPRSSATQQPCTGYRRLSASSRLLWPTPFPLVTLVDPSTVCQLPEGCEQSLDAVQYSQREGSKDSKKCLPFPPPGKERKHTTNIYKISSRTKAH